jgi:hypothetical protein
MDSDFSRRSMLQQMATTVAGTVTVLTIAAKHAQAQNKLAKKDVNYQEKPNGNQKCENCVNFEAPSGCKVVDGPVIPQAWCKAYGPKPS